MFFAIHGRAWNTINASVSILHLIVKLTFVLVRNSVRSSYSQWELVVTGIQTLVLVVASPALYYKPIPLFPN